MGEASVLTPEEASEVPPDWDEQMAMSDERPIDTDVPLRARELPGAPHWLSDPAECRYQFRAWRNKVGRWRGKEHL